MTTAPFWPFECWLAWLDSHDGRLKRAVENKRGERESDVACLIPTPPGQSIFTVGDLRALVEAGRELARLRQAAPLGPPEGAP